MEEKNTSHFVFLAKSDCLEFDIRGNTPHETDILTYQLIYPFVSHINKAENLAAVPCYNRNNEALRERIKEVVNILKSSNPRIYKLFDYFEKVLAPDEVFFMSVNSEMTQSQMDAVLTSLSSIDATAEDQRQNQKVLDTINSLKAVYNIKVYGNKRITIGEPNKDKRVCRYCHKKKPEVQFKEVAHTISESIGNKNIITNDECDSCNNKFGRTIEEDFFSSVEILRMMFCIRGKKGGTPKMKGSNFELETDTNGNLNLKIKADPSNHNSATILDNSQSKLILKGNRPITSQNVYRALCKYGYGILDADILPHFERLRKWLIGESTESCFPKVARLYHPKVVQQPTIMLYTRKQGARKDLPYTVVELRVMNLAYIYILPFSDEDICDFSKDDDYQRFWAFFTIYNDKPGWQFIDGSSVEPINPTFNLNFSERTN